MVHALSVHMVLPLGHVGLLPGVCARWGDSGLVKAKVVAVRVSVFTAHDHLISGHYAPTCPRAP